MGRVTGGTAPIGTCGRVLGAPVLAIAIAACGVAPDDPPLEQGPPPAPLPSYECLVDRECSARMVAAHRGFHLLHPENSLAAVCAAAGLGASFAEIDVRHTADEILVLMHDATVDGTTDGTGEVSALSYAQIAELHLDGAPTEDEEDQRVPRFVDALDLAQQLGIMLYVDMKTDRTDLVVKVIASGSSYQEALVRGSIDQVAAIQQLDGQVLVMPAVESETDLVAASSQVADLLIVELTAITADPAFTAAANQAGIKVQQDVMVGGDIAGMAGDYQGYQQYMTAGVSLLQTDLPDVLVPAVREFNETGVFPTHGPGRP